MRDDDFPSWKTAGAASVERAVAAAAAEAAQPPSPVEAFGPVYGGVNPLYAWMALRYFRGTEARVVLIDRDGSLVPRDDRRA